MAMTEVEEDEVGAFGVDRTTGPIPVFDNHCGGADAAGDVHCGGALAGTILKGEFGFVDGENSIFGIIEQKEEKNAVYDSDKIEEMFVNTEGGEDPKAGFQYVQCPGLCRGVVYRGPVRICGRRCWLRYGHLCTHRCDEHWNWNLKDKKAVYDENVNLRDKEVACSDSENKSLKDKKIAYSEGMCSEDWKATCDEDTDPQDVKVIYDKETGEYMPMQMRGGMFMLKLWVRKSTEGF